jgi:hypothetical protein
MPFLDRFLLAAKGFEHHLRAVPADGWGAPDALHALDPGLLRWLDENFDAIFSGFAETSRFFADPPPGPPGASRQDRLLTRFGRDPRRPGSPAAP